MTTLSTIAMTQVLASNPAESARVDGSPITTTSAKTIDLNTALNTIVPSIKSGALSLPAPTST